MSARVIISVADSKLFRTRTGLAATGALCLAAALVPLAGCTKKTTPEDSGSARSAAQKPAQAPPKDIPEGMVYVPGGKSYTGCTPGFEEYCQSDEKPRVQVELSSFFIDTHEVTVARYKACVDAGGCQAPAMVYDADHDVAVACNWGRPESDQHPINCVTWDEADTFCRWDAKQLPSESQWERAAAGATGSLYPWGDTPPANCQQTHMHDPVKGHGCGTNTTATVGSYPAGVSALGVHDMAGNVWEWVSNWYGKNDYDYLRGVDPKGAETGKLKVQRGGAYTSKLKNLRTTNRNYANPDAGYRGVGMRCAVTLEQRDAAKKP